MSELIWKTGAKIMTGEDRRT